MGSQAVDPQAATRVMAALRRLVRLLRLGSHEAQATTGVSSAQLFVLEQLGAAEASSMQELAARTLTDASSVSTVVARLEERGLVERTRSPVDGRRFTLRITPRGRALVARAPELPQVRVIRAVEALSLERRRALADTLDRIVAHAGGQPIAPKFFFEDETLGQARKIRGQPRAASRSRPSTRR